MKKKIIVLGSTGSVGIQALKILKEQKNHFELVGIAAGNSRIKLLEKQSKEFGNIDYIVGNNSTDLSKNNIAEYIIKTEADLVLNAIDGFAGLVPSIAALESNKQLALANKETLIFGGELIRRKYKNAKILPVDSEHSAIFQVLQGEEKSTIKQLVLTASGGPFKNYKYDQLGNINVNEAINHPTWSMGKNISLNSATMVNKGLEIIEAHYLFNIPYEQIETVVHPQSIVHSFVIFNDNSIKMQASIPTMELPISYAINFPHRTKNNINELDYKNNLELTFKEIDHKIFTTINLAKKCGKLGGIMPIVFNAANEEVSKYFFEEKIKFLDIFKILKNVVEIAIPENKKINTIQDIVEYVDWAKAITRDYIGSNINEL